MAQSLLGYKEVKALEESERLKALRKALNIKQGDFASKISTTQGHISDIENGRKNLSDRTIKLICLENWNGKTVNSEWLRTGEGEMFLEMGRDEEITAWAAKITRGDYSNKFVPEFAHLLTQLNEKDWERIEWFMKGLIDKKED